MLATGPRPDSPGVSIIDTRAVRAGDLDQVAGEDSPPGTFERIDPGAVPPVLVFEAADPALAPGSPLHLTPERSAVFDVSTGPRGSHPTPTADQGREWPPLLITSETFDPGVVGV